MAITTYSELKTAIEQWLDTAGDTTISSNVDEFIDLTEALIRIVTGKQLQISPFR